MDYTSYTGLKVENANGVTTITFIRPEVKNAINKQIHHELSRIWADVDDDPDTDVVVIQGSGGSFCAGGDLAWIAETAGDALAVAQGQRTDRRISDDILAVEKPMIAKVDGPAVGLGCTLALYCDFVYATERSIFADPHVAVGLVAGDGGAVLWPQLIGYARAKRYLLTGDKVTARVAENIGLITQCVADADELDAVADEMVERMRTGAKLAIQFTKASINAGLKQVSSVVTDRAAGYEGLTLMGEDVHIAIEAFGAKKKPVFTGR